MAKKIDYASLYTLRKDGRYVYRWTDATGKRRAIYDRDPEKLHKKIEAMENGGTVTFQDVAKKWEREHLSKVSAGTYSSYKKPYETLVEELGNRPIQDISTADINNILLREKKQQYSQKHAATVKSVFKQIMDVAILDKLIQYNPATMTRVPRGMKKKHVEAPEAEIVDVIASNLDKPFGNFVAMLLYTGMRTEEAAALTWADIGDKYISVSKAADLHGTPKIKEAKTEAGEREIPIVKKHRPFLIMPDGAQKSDYIFSHNGKLLTRGQITARWKKWCRLAGLSEPREYICKYKGKEIKKVEWKPLIQPHQLRHHYATILYEQKVDLMAAKDIMGHKDIQTTQSIYTSLRKKHRDEELAKIEQGF